MLVGNPSTFAIESDITVPYEQPGQLALGSFIIHVGGKEYGVRSRTATLLACSLDAVKRRIAHRGRHVAAFGSESASARIVDAVCGAGYDLGRQTEKFFGLSAAEFTTKLHSCEIVWAPDGDAAFDDGGHVLQFDVADQVRLIAFKNLECMNDVLHSMAEAWLSANEFYQTLDDWQQRLAAERTEALRSARRQ